MVHRTPTLDAAFAALSDGTRRAILERLGRGNAPISELAASAGLTLTGVRKHVRRLELAGLVTTRKIGRVRTCSLGPGLLQEESAWILEFQHASLLASMQQTFAELGHGPSP